MRPYSPPLRRLSIVLALIPAMAGLVSSAAGQSLERLFYYADREASFESLRDNIGRIDIIAPASYSVDQDGVVWGEVDARVIELARAHGVPVMPLIHNPGFNQEMLHELLASDEARSRTIASLLELCRRYGFDGIQFDFENLNINDRDAFTRFYRNPA